MMDKWHENADERKKFGDKSEALFVDMVACRCGGKFARYDNLMGQPDFKCESCGQLVDVKGSPIAGGTGNITVSARPWNNYTDRTLIAAMIDCRWLGEYKKNIHTTNSLPNAPTHSSTHTALKNTSWYYVSISNFKALESLGYHITYQSYTTVKLDNLEEALQGYAVTGSSWPDWSPCPIVEVRKID